MLTVLFILFLAFIIIFPIVDNKREKRKNREEKSKNKTKVENYLWLIKLLKSNGYNLKDKTGINTSHAVLEFENSQGKIIKIEQDYTILDDNQGKLFLISGNKKIQTYFYPSENMQKDIETWVIQL